jgi:alpha-ketoglutarate-dependent taurine dioxygenase
MKPATAPAHVTWAADALSMTWPDGTSGRFSSLWLRDNRPQDRDPGSGQRLVDVADLPEAPAIRSVTSGDGVVSVQWENDTEPASFSWAWLARQALQRDPAEFRRRLWLDGARLDAGGDFAWCSYEEARHDAGARFAWLERLQEDGLVFLRDVPNEESTILAAAALAGRVCETNYGVLFDVRVVPQPENLAYSDLGLGLHTDNPYREPVPGYQALHVLSAAPDGGHSLFADGWALAEYLRESDPDTFHRLAHTSVGFVYRSKDAELRAERPLIQLSCSGAVTAVHYNNRSIAPLRMAGAELDAYYRCYRRFALLLRTERFQLKTTLRAGELVLFDNQRVLHGRTAFASARHARHLQGCYLTRDSVQSTTAVLGRACGQENSE